MKKLILILALASVGAFAQTAPAPVTPPPAAALADPIAAITKERDDAKAQVTQLQATQQQQAVVTEYYKVVAERNEALLRLTQANQQITALQGEVDHLKAAAASKK